MRNSFNIIPTLFIILFMILLFLCCKTLEFESSLLYIDLATDLEKAISYLHKSLKKEPNDIEAYIALGQAYGMKGDYLQMTSALDTAMTLIDTTRT